VDKDRGLRRHFRQTAIDDLKLCSDGDDTQLERENNVGDNLKLYLLESGIDGVEIARAAHSSHYRWACGSNGSTISVPTILTFDAHCIEDFCRPEWVTHVKMTNLSLQGLKDALAFPETRIRFPQNLPISPSPYIAGLQVIGGPVSFFQDESIAFAENLNCLIGPRGSGKSTVVEALRYVFGQNRQLSAMEGLETPIRDLQKANLVDSLVRVMYRGKSGDRILESTFDVKADYATKVYTTAGEYVDVADVEVNGDFPVRLFGWSEIETIGRDSSRQREMLDRLIPDIGPVLGRRAEIRRQLRDNRVSIKQAVTDLRSAYDKSGGEIRRYKEYKSDFDKLNTAEVRGLFGVLDLVHAKQGVLAKVKSNLASVTQSLGDPADLTLRDGLEEVLAAGEQTLRDWWLAEEIQRLNLLCVEQGMQGALRAAIEGMNSLRELVDQHLAALSESERSVEDSLRAQFSGDASKQRIASLRENAKRRWEHVCGLRDEYLRRWDQLQSVLAERETILSKLIDAQDQIAGLRSRHNQRAEETLNQSLPDSMRVSIEFVAGGDTQQFHEAVTPFLKAATRYKARNLAQVVAKFYNPPSFARLIRSGLVEDVTGKSAQTDGGKSEITEEDTKKISEATDPYAFDEYADCQILADGGARLDRILELQEVEWDDRETILLNGRPVNEMSPGQRSSAMLPLIALAETTPLVIDQPEDNLDKRLIGGVLANVLAKLKETRQIIVCTHDPNIVVGGDAEQVVVLEALSNRKGKVSTHGSIDNEDIVRTIIDLLEGGKEAFESRSKRYGARTAATRS
jgi:energy-coupling factor transporter ATP-binding protein EcfA2